MTQSYLAEAQKPFRAARNEDTWPKNPSQLSKDNSALEFGDLAKDALPPVSPGEILALEFMQPLGLSARGLAAELNVPPNRISEIIKGERIITPDTALRLEKHFGVSAEFWLTLQMKYDLKQARRNCVGAERPQ